MESDLLSRVRRSRTRRQPHMVHDFYDRRGDAIYVGRTVDFAARLNTHRRVQSPDRDDPNGPRAPATAAPPLTPANTLVLLEHRNESHAGERQRRPLNPVRHRPNPLTQRRRVERRHHVAVGHL